ncbi:MAG: hypothetical protein M0Z72_06670 [Deltaproteobacteria bacterium]|nr:hypothetical protein [Deltaproteobacteria bacterium]
MKKFLTFTLLTFGTIAISMFYLTSPITAQSLTPTTQQSYYYTGIYNGQTVYLQLVPNVTVESLPDATIVGTLSDFYTNQPDYLSPPYAELNGESLNVWTAPAEFPGEYVVHNGLEGPQPAYGTWIIVSAQITPPPVVPQYQPSVNITVEAPYFITSIGEGVAVYYLPAISSFAFSYNGFYFSWVNNIWEYSNYYYGPWLPLTPVIVLPPPLLYGPPPPVFAYRPYFLWWKGRIGPWYRIYHPGWWYRHHPYMRHYRIWERRVLPFYANHPFYYGKIHRIIRPVGGRLIFPKGVHPIIGKRGRVIYPGRIRPFPFRKPRIPIRFIPVRHFKSIKPIIPIRRPILPSLPQRRIYPIIPPGVRPPSPHYTTPYTTGPIMKHPVGIYRGIGIPPHKPVNRKPPVYQFPAKPFKHIPSKQPVSPPPSVYYPVSHPNIYHSPIRPVPIYHPPIIQKSHSTLIPHKMIGHPAANGKHKTSHKNMKK